MARNRTIYNVLALFASQVTGANALTGTQTGAGDILQVPRVQSFDEDFTRTFTDINQYGNLAAIDRLETQPPEVTASFSYYLSDGKSESVIGLGVTQSGVNAYTPLLSGIANKVTDAKNYYLLIADEGNDANANTTARSGIIGIGNAYISSYSVKGAVGDIPSADVNLEALNIRVYSNVTSTGVVPAIDVSNGDGAPAAGAFRLPLGSSYTGTNIPAALQPGDIVFTLPGGSTVGYVESDLKVQDFTITVDMPRTAITKLGNRFGISREIDYPITAKIDVNAEVGDITDGNIANQLCSGSEFDFSIVMNKPYCAGSTPSTALAFQVKKAKLISQSFSSSIGNNTTMSASYEVSIGAASQTDRGVFVSGTYLPSIN